MSLFAMLPNLEERILLICIFPMLNMVSCSWLKGFYQDEMTLSASFFKYRIIKTKIEDTQMKSR